MTQSLKNLVKSNSFVRGMVRVVDLGCSLNGNIRDRYIESDLTDAQKLSNDWAKVGQDIASSITRFDRESKNEQ